MNDPEKLSTAEILAKIRAQGAAGGAESKDESAEESPQTESAASKESAAAESNPAESPPESPKPAEPASPAATPNSTSDILAAVRAQQAGGEAPAAESKPAESKPAESKPAAKPAGKPGATPTSTKDILAAVRGKGGAAAEKPAAAKADAKGAPATKAPAGKPAPAGERPSVQEMVRAARQGQPVPTEAAPKPAKPVPPPLPPRPAPPAKGKPAQQPRRNFLWAMFSTPFALAWTAFTATTIAAILGTARFMFPNVLVEPPSKFKVGPPSDYPLNTVSNKYKAQSGIWVVRTDQYDGRDLVYALISVCTHLGCTPNWLEGEQKFKCPCHGSGFYITGVNFEGPAPRPLERAGMNLAEDGMLEVDKSLKFQEEMGQWLDPASYYESV